MYYGVEVWGGYSFAPTVFIEHKRAIRIIKGLSPLISCEALRNFTVYKKEFLSLMLKHRGRSVDIVKF